MGGAAAVLLSPPSACSPCKLRAPLCSLASEAIVPKPHRSVCGVEKVPNTEGAEESFQDRDSQLAA